MTGAATQEPSPTLSVGVLHSAAQLIDLLGRRNLAVREVIEGFPKILVCPPSPVLTMALRCNWVEILPDGLLAPTLRGRELLEGAGFAGRLRGQLGDFVAAVGPSWARLFAMGRDDLRRYAPAEVVQILDEAGAMVPFPADDVVRWWDQLAGRWRAAIDDSHSESGRVGERLTIERERRRTGREPHWKALESVLCGYDVLSVVSSDDPGPLCIEVKASREPLRYARFHVSAGEWATACTSRAYVFHLWLLADPSNPALAELPAAAVEPHIPRPIGDGEWESVRIPFGSFSAHFAQTGGTDRGE